MHHQGGWGLPAASPYNSMQAQMDPTLQMAQPPQYCKYLLSYSRHALSLSLYPQIIIVDMLLLHLLLRLLLLPVQPLTPLILH